ncbi:MAG: MinD/ParA family protein [Planctomycetaceae bacterium]|nr:MinD/ParA family protein [Planctomycetaceae bacterium]
MHGPGDVVHLQQGCSSASSCGAAIIAVTSGKGGVGKTNIAANLSLCMAMENQRVLLLDADMGLGNLDIVLNIQCRYNLMHAVSGVRSLDQVIQVGPAGVEIICGGSGVESLANLNNFQRQRLIEQLQSLQSRCDILLVDTGAGIHSTVIAFCLSADHTLVVTTPEPTAMTDAYAMIKVLAANHYAGRISLLVNMAQNLAEGRKIYRQIADVAGRFLNVAVYEAGILCRDECLVQAVRRREPVVQAFPRSQIAGALAAVSRRLTHTAYERTGEEGFFRKVVDWFF